MTCLCLFTYCGFHVFALILDNMKSAVTAKLVHQASDFYADAMKLLQLGSIREIWPKVKKRSLYICIF